MRKKFTTGILSIICGFTSIRQRVATWWSTFTSTVSLRVATHLRAAQAVIHSNRITMAFGFLLAAYLVDLLFTVVEWNAYMDKFHCWTGHCFTGEIWNTTNYYHYFAHLSIACILISAGLFTWRGVFVWLVGLEILDTVDYAITFNTAYHTIHGPLGAIDIDFNLFKTLGAAALIAKEYYNGVRN